MLLEEHAHQHWEINEWADAAKQVRDRYGDIPFYCDSARPEHVQRFRREGLRAYNAEKSVLSGIEKVATRIKLKTLLITSGARRFKDEVAQYVWDEKSGEPVKVMDDVMDSMRYAIYTHYNSNRRARIVSRNELGL